MVKSILCLLMLGWSSMSLGKGQISLAGPVGVPVPSGSSAWTAKLAQPVAVSPLQVMFWNTGSKCPRMPVVNVSVKYANDVYWYNAPFKQGYYQTEERFKIEAVKLDFYSDAPDEVCVITVAGYRDIAEFE